MKIYHTCECCQRVYKTSEIDGPSGAIELSDLCPECQQEIGLSSGQNLARPHFYN